MQRRLLLLALIAGCAVSITAQDRTASTGAVMGFVRYASGGGIADVRVSVITPGDPLALTTRTTSDGSYRFDAIPAGQYQLSVSHAGAVPKRIVVTPGSELKDVNFSIPDGGARRVVTGRVVMNEASRGRQLPPRIGVGIILRRDGTLVLPIPPGDNRVFVRLPADYFLDSVAHGSEIVYSMQGDGRRLSAANVSITVRAEPDTIPELVITVGFRQ
jgi:hypothetical protein